MPTAIKYPAPVTVNFADDGTVPNNPTLPLVLHRNGIDLAGTPDPERLIEKTFAANGWGDVWRNGIYPFVHYHSMIHEALGVARGRATVRFGGDNGREIEIAAGDVAILPAGTGHQCLSRSPDLLSSAPILRAANTTSAAAARRTTRGRSPRSRKCRSLPPIRCLGRKGRWSRCGAHDLVAPMTLYPPMTLYRP
jgi:uncharacterized protein YjlB